VGGPFYVTASVYAICKSMRIEILKEPPRATAQEKKVRIIHGRPQFYEPENVKKAKAWLITELKPYAPVTPIEGPVLLEVCWCFHGKKLDWKTTRPDTDNLEKMLKDVMTDLGFWKDDAQVCNEIVRKLYNPQPKLIIEVVDLNHLPT
jgi:Holliday junction resolvase RusA-like endonuclease